MTATDPSAAMTIFRQRARTFHLAALLMPRAVRRDLARLYHFCRTVDDVADAGAGRDSAPASDMLSRIERQLLGADEPTPAVRSFLDVSRRRGVPNWLAIELVRGVRTDLDAVAMASQAELLRYGYRVASTVGLMLCFLLDVRREAHPFAIDLGIAMQLTNIARDVGEDARMGRVYLPADWIDPALVRRAAMDDDHRAAEAAFGAAARLLDLAADYYRSADRGTRFLPRSARLGVLAAARNYEAIGGRVRALGPSWLHRRARLGLGAKVVRSAGSAVDWVRDEWAARLPAHEPTLHDELRGLPLVA